MADVPGAKADEPHGERRERSGPVPAIADIASVESLVEEGADVLDPSEADALPALLLEAGQCLSGRFVVERFAGIGGMGVVHRGTDLHTREAVAIKVMARQGPDDRHRFAQEVAVLAELSHPAIVRYIAHGTTARGMPFLVMEWLNGEDLAMRFERSPLTAEESLSLVRRACEAIAVAHARGVVHRDIKPSNLFLVNGNPAWLKVLDFGIARPRDGARLLTRSGTVLGTVGYMSPEQAMAASDVDARADVFALGCVLFECLAGRAAFVAPNPVAVLAKVLREEPPRVSELRPGLEALDALVARMMAKKPEKRPKDAAEVLVALDSLGRAPSSELPLSGRQEGLTGGEQRIVSVILGEPRDTRSAEPVSREQLEIEVGRFREITSRFGAESMVLRGGALLIVLSGRGAATDQAAQAATCALLLGRLRPDLRLGVATGLAETTGRIPVGAAIDRAAELVGWDGGLDDEIGIDALTAGLLDPRFDVQREDDKLVLIGHGRDFEGTRLLMGKPTPFLGRDKELAFLDLTLRQCIEESVARAVLITGPPGQGKSRLRHELVEKARERDDVRILMARADPVGAGSAFMLARQLVLRAVGLREGASPAEQHAGLRAYVARVCKDEDFGRIADFLGELIGVPSSEGSSPEFRAARSDPQIMGVWLRRSFGEWLVAECAVTPLLLVLEDLHWGDLPSVTYVGEALRGAATKPLMVLALARPEVHEAFPHLWTGTEKLDVVLGRLTPRAAERLARGALGEKAARDTVSRIVERADGNAFYLEELIRRVAEGGEETLPETVLALVQSRLEQLELDARRIVRAASVFGGTFWGGGIAALLGTAPEVTDLEAWLRALVDRELFTATRESRFPGESEYTFRHGLVRESAYATLTDVDRATGHRLAGDWLERVGEKDALTLADHFEQGGDDARATPWLVQAAQTARDGGNVEVAIGLGRRGISGGAQGVQRGLLSLVVTQALGMRGDWIEGVDPAREAMALLPAGSTPWFEAVGAALMTGALLGDLQITTPAIHAVVSVPVPTERSGPYGFAVLSVTQGLACASQVEAARSVLAGAEAIATGAPEADLVFDMWIRIARSVLQLGSAEFASALANLSEARALADRTGSASGRALSSMYLVFVLSQTGAIQRASMATAELVSFSEPLGRRFESDWAQLFLTWARVASGRVAAEDIALLRALLGQRDHLMVTSARAVLSQALVAVGDIDGASREATLAMEGAVLAWSQATALRSGALVELGLGRPERALALADKGLEAGAASNQPTTDSTLRLARAEALRALGRVEESRDAIREARDRVLRIAAAIEDPELCVSYVTNIVANARTLQFASAWLDEEGLASAPASTKPGHDRQ
jgi:eukaryotic-like serine/threonine-protein kinase